MRQLVQLKKHADEFEKYNTEIIVVFREERQGVEGLKKIKETQKVDFTLALDFKKESTGAYSPGRMKFDNYVVDKSGEIKAVIDGNLRVRAQAEELLKVLGEIKQ